MAGIEISHRISHRRGHLTGASADECRRGNVELYRGRIDRDRETLVAIKLVGAGPTKVAWKDGTRTVPTENFEEGVKPGGTKRFQLELRFSAGKF